MQVESGTEPEVATQSGKNHTGGSVIDQSSEEQQAPGI